MKPNQDYQEGGFLGDEKIVELYWQREERAIEETDRKYGKYLYTIAYHIVHDRLDSEECLNDTYLGTWNSIPPAKPTLLQVFVSKIMRNVAVNRFKSNTALKRIPSELTRSLEELDECMAYSPTPEEERVASETGRVISEYLRGLRDREAFAFICRYYYSDTVVDIASMLNVSRNTVFRDLAQMRNELKERLEKEGLWHE